MTLHMQDMPVYHASLLEESKSWMTRHKIGLTLLTQLVGLLENKLHIYSRQMTNQTTKCKQIVRIEREINFVNFGPSLS